MEQLPTWLAAAVAAAGMTTVYNADDWERIAEKNNKAAKPPQPEAGYPAAPH